MIDWLVRRVNRLVLGPHRELKRPANNVDYSLLERQEHKRRELDAKGVKLKAIGPTP